MTPSYHGLDESSALQPHLLEVSVDVEDAVLLRQLDVGVDGQVHAGPTGAVTDRNQWRSSTRVLTQILRRSWLEARGVLNYKEKKRNSKFS